MNAKENLPLPYFLGIQKAIFPSLSNETMLIINDLALVEFSVDSPCRPSPTKGPFELTSAGRQTSLGPVELVTMLHLWNWSHMFCTCRIGHNFFSAVVELVTLFRPYSTTA